MAQLFGLGAQPRFKAFFEVSRAPKLFAAPKLQGLEPPALLGALSAAWDKLPGHGLLHPGFGELELLQKLNFLKAIPPPPKFPPSKRKKQWLRFGLEGGEPL